MQQQNEEDLFNFIQQEEENLEKFQYQGEEMEYDQEDMENDQDAPDDQLLNSGEMDEMDF